MTLPNDHPKIPEKKKGVLLVNLGTPDSTGLVGHKKIS